jgi:glycosyltransferase involved in cell wall biosynthesis
MNESVAIGSPSVGAAPSSVRGHRRPRLVHLTTTDMSLDWLLGPQLRAFGAAGYEVIGVSAAGDHVEAIESAGVRHLALRHATRAMSLGDDAKAVAELYGVFRRLRPDIVHTHNPKPGVYGRLAARAARVPVIVNTQHGLYALPEDRLAKRSVVYGLERVAAACSDRELVQNPDDVATLRRLTVPDTKLVTLGNGVDLGRFDPDAVAASVRAELRASIGVSDTDVVVGLVGRLVAEKGYREVFDAARHVRSEHPSARFVVIGPSDPDKGDAITADEQARAVEEAGFVFLGRRDDVHDWYAAMDLYVLASHREGFPRSAMEAAAMGLPLVATDVRGCRNVVDDRVTGRLVPVGDPRALAAAIGDLVADPARRSTMGTASRAKAVREFDQQRVIDITLGAYADLLRAAAAGD